LDYKNYKRIIIVGNSGSGKSYLSTKLSAITGLPLVHLDAVFWRPNWEKTPRDEWIEKQKEMLAGREWIIDGNYGSTLALRFEAADVIIFLDINRLQCIVSAFKRQGKKRLDLPGYLIEKRDFGFLKFCLLIWNFHKKGRKTILELHEKYPEKPFIIIRKRNDFEAFINSWQAGLSAE